MERNRELRELAQREMEKLETEKIFESAFFRQMLLSVAGEMTGGTLKRVELVKEPEDVCAGQCGREGVVLNLQNKITVSFHTVPLMSDSLIGILGHECGHWNFSDFKIRKEYLDGLENGEWYQSEPRPETEEEKEHLKEINGYLKNKHPIVCALLCETASFIQNMLEDIFVEQKMCERYPGSIRRGILQNRMRRTEWIPSLKAQLEKGYDPASVLLNLMAQYSLSGTINNWEGQTGEIIDLLEMTKPVIDDAVAAKEPEMRMAATNRILLMIWSILAKEIQENDSEPQEEESEDDSQEPENGQQERQSTGDSRNENPQNSHTSGDSQNGSQEDSPSDGDSQQGSHQDGQSNENSRKHGQRGNQSVKDSQPASHQDGEPTEDSQNSSQKDSQPSGEPKPGSHQEEQPDENSRNEDLQSSQPSEVSQTDGTQGGDFQKENKTDGNSKLEDRKECQTSQETEKNHQAKGGTEESGETQPKDSESVPEKGLSDAESRQELQKRAEQILGRLRKQLPAFLLEKDQKDAAEKPRHMTEERQEATKGRPDAAEEQEIDLRDLLMEHIRELAENNAQRELDEKIRRELYKELSETVFDGDHQKVKKVILRESEISQEHVMAYQLYEDRVKDVMRRMKPRLLPVLSCQKSRMERNLFFGAKLDFQALYEPSKRIFRNMEMARKVDTAVALLIDLSASMQGERIEQAKLCALCLYEFCHHVGIPVLIYGHNVTKAYRRVEDETVSLYSFAEFEADRNDKYRIASMTVKGCNRDGAALCFIGQKLEKRPEKIKLLFSISDGFPNATQYSGQKAEEDLLRIKESLEKKRTTVLTAAIGSDKEVIQRIYKEGFLDISDIEQLPFILPKQILMRIKK